MLIARSTIQPKLNKIKVPFTIFWWILMHFLLFFWFFFNFGWMVDLAMSIFEFPTKFLVIWHPWHPWVCIRSDLKPLETDMSDSSYCARPRMRLLMTRRTGVLLWKHLKVKLTNPAKKTFRCRPTASELCWLHENAVIFLCSTLWFIMVLPKVILLTFLFR